MQKGLVIKNTGSWYTVLTDDGQLHDCKIKGNFRLRGIRSTNPIAVGDRVTIQTPPPSSGATGGGFITEIEDRKNYIIRKSINLSKQSHILAANVDQALLIITVSKPETSTTFIDRFLASAEAYRVPVILIYNKSDLLNEEERHYQQMMINLYETIGYECRAISAQTGEGVEELRPLLHGKITLLSGNSGVGKSTLINRLVPGANLRTADISDAHQTGMHTTTFSEMINLSPALPQGEGETSPQPSPKGRGKPLPSPPPRGGGNLSPTLPKGEGAEAATSREALPSLGGVGGGCEASTSREALPSLGGVGGGFLIDTPGIKGFGTFDMEREELTSYFKEIFEFSKQCRFSDCTHTHEPGCAVLKAVEDHYIAQSRYQSYLSMLDDKDENKYREAF